MSQVNAVVTQMPERLMVTVPASKEASVLAKALQEQEHDPELFLTSLNLTKACSLGDNYMSLIQRASVIAKKSDGHHIQKGFLMKVQLQDEVKRIMLNSDAVWANEEYMYNIVFPEMMKACQSDLYIPKYYFSDSSIMVLEDLNEFGYKMVDRIKGLNLDQTLTVVNRLSHFHAASLALQYKNPSLFNSIRKTHQHPYVSHDCQEKTAPMINKAIMNAAEVLENEPDPTKHSDAIQFLYKLAENQRDIIKFLQAVPENDTAVVIHGDLWINNILFLEDPKTNKTLDVKFVDFQGSRMGTAVNDLHHVLFTSLQSDVRIEHLDAILQYYYENQINYLKEFMESPNVDYHTNIWTFDKLLNDFKKYRLYGLLNAILMLPVITLDPKKETYDFTNMDSNNNTNGFRKKLLVIIDEFRQKNWLNFD